MDVVAALGGISNAITIARALQSIDRSYDSAVLKGQLAEIMSALADAKMTLSDAREEIAEKDREIKRLRGDFAARDELKEYRGYKYKSDPVAPNGINGTPICPRCETVDGRLIYTVAAHSVRGMGTSCPQCKVDLADAYVLRFEPGPAVA